PRSDARGRDALGGVGVRDGGRGRARVRAGRADAREGASRDRRALPRRGAGPLPRGDPVAAVQRLLRRGAVDRRPPGRVLRCVEGRDVKYRYRCGPMVLHGITLSVRPGGHIAIVGETGCGKTTFAKLMSRLADPIEGAIVVGGVNLRDVVPASRRLAIRMVPQDGFLFDSSVREYVRYGRLGARDRDVKAAFEEIALADWGDSRHPALETH